jgi:hypothetical protein
MEKRDNDFIHAPFTEEQVASLNGYQSCGVMHPFTCGGTRGDKAHRAYAKRHGGDEGQLVATKDGWKCPVCDYCQDWAHAFMGDGSWEKMRKEIDSVLGFVFNNPVKEEKSS